MENGQPPLPDVSKWQPRDKADEKLSTAFYRKCKAIEDRILLRVKHEKEMNIDNFDSGPGVEDIVRDELSQLLPARYSVRCGVINDAYGLTGGDHDVVIFNSHWMPTIKDGATPSSRRSHFPIEGVYAVGEIKQTLTFASLDEAMEKLVVTHRLFRSPTSADRVVENREMGDCPHGLTNPLFSFIVATRLDPALKLDDVIQRFVAINRRLRRLEMVRSLAILGEGAVHWVAVDEAGSSRPALFMSDDLHDVLHIGLENVATAGSAIYPLVRTLMTHLFHSVLAAEDIAVKYGRGTMSLKIAMADDMAHDPYFRPAASSSLPWDYEMDLASGKVDRVLGAHICSTDDD